MSLLKIAALTSFLALPSAASELGSLRPADIREKYSDISVPAPVQALAESALTAPAARTPAEEVLPPKPGLDPVVITVPGLKFGEIGWGPLELRNLLRLIKFFTRNKDITDADVADGIVGFSPRYFFPPREIEQALAAEGAFPRLPDNYLELKLKEIPGYENHSVVVLPFAWSRDPGDSKAEVLRLQAKIEETYDAFKGSGRPIYILAHSWGSVLAHTALHRVCRERPDVKIDKLITAGSPLVPANPVVKMFMKFEVMKQDLEKRVAKPANVAVWRNYWAHRDAYSNDIPAADFNYQADRTVENYEPTLINLILHNKLLRKEARLDLFKMRDIKAWHGAYFYDYKASLKSIEKEITVEVFRPAVAPQVVDCNKDPAAHMCRP